MTFQQTHYIRCGIRVGIVFCVTASGVCDGLSERNSAFAQESTVNTRQLIEPSRAQRILDSMNAADDHSVLIAAHRGGYTNDREDGAPENSVANVEIAVAKGYEVFETDIRRTDDGVFVIVHDATLDRETNGTGPVEAMTLEPLHRLRKRYRDGSLSDHKVATLTELLNAGKDRILFKADLKPGVIAHFDQLSRLIAKHPAATQVFLRTGFDDADAIQRCFAEGTPKVEIMFKVDTASQVKQVHKRFAPRTIQINIAKGESLSESEREAIRTAQVLGILVETHVYNSPQQTVALLDAGVRMLHTAKPRAVRGIVDAHSPEAERPVDRFR